MDATCCIAFGRYPIRYFYIEARSKNRDFKIQRRGRQQERPKKKPTGLISKTTTLQVHHALLYISFLHDYDVKMPNFAFYGVRKQATTKFCFPFCTWIWS